jgi:sugar-phosphatase
MICAEDVTVGKPSPEGYLLAAAALGLDAKLCVVVEDAPAGIAAGLTAGARVVAVTTTHTADQVAGADVIVADMSCLRVELTDDGVVVNRLESS